MSLQEWKDEFYPCEAEEATGTLKEAIEHSIRKWTGLREKNLKKHDVVANSPHAIGNVRSGVFLDIDDESCALCHKFLIPNEDCSGCPLKNMTHRCSPHSDGWGDWIGEFNPEPMIAFLKEALRYYE